MLQAHNPDPSTATRERFHDLSVPVNAPRNRRLRVLLLADNRHFAGAVQDHVSGITNLCRHRISVVNPLRDKAPRPEEMNTYDALLIHYSILILSDTFLPQDFAELVRNFPGPKAQIVQDECRWINQMKRRMIELGIGAVFSSLEVDNMRRVYEGSELGSVSFFSCLPGYIADRLKNIQTVPIKDRCLDIVYRGRELPYWLGKHAQEKTRIALQVADIARAHGLAADIESREEKRIYGGDWQSFLTSGRATIGGEGGASIFDFDGEAEAAVKGYLKEHPDASFDEVASAVLSECEGNIVHKTITPKIFEAIATRTALVLYPGRYRDILVEGRHYIALQRDGSNADEVVKQLRDHELLQELVDRAYEEIVPRSDLAMSYYVRGIGNVLSHMHAGTLTRLGAVDDPGKSNEGARTQRGDLEDRLADLEFNLRRYELALEGQAQRSLESLKLDERFAELERRLAEQLTEFERIRTVQEDTTLQRFARLEAIISRRLAKVDARMNRFNSRIKTLRARPRPLIMAGLLNAGRRAKSLLAALLGRGKMTS